MMEMASPSIDVGSEDNYWIQYCSGGCLTMNMHAKAP